MSAESNSVASCIGRYRVVRQLGQGAMGRVLLAHDPVLQRDVAIKHLRSDLQIPCEQVQPLIERMRQEARASARVSHPNLVALHDMGEDTAVGLYLVFEYVEGDTLKERLQRGPLDVATAAQLVEELGVGLSFAHAAGILHRDVKPENVILSKTGAKLADFGIARLPGSTLTQGTGIVLGTPAYSAPEAIMNGAFSPASDQFSLAATLYEALSGRRAFPGDDPVAVAARIANDPVPKMAQSCGLHPEVDAVLQRALAKDPTARHSSCAEFGRALCAALLPELGRPESEFDAASAVPKARSRLATLPDQQHGLTDAAVPPRRAGIGWTLVVALVSALFTWAAMTFFTPSSTSARFAAPANDEDRVTLLATPVGGAVVEAPPDTQAAVKRPPALPGKPAAAPRGTVAVPAP